MTFEIQQQLKLIVMECALGTQCFILKTRTEMRMLPLGEHNLSSIQDSISKRYKAGSNVCFYFSVALDVVGTGRFVVLTVLLTLPATLGRVITHCTDEGMSFIRVSVYIVLKQKMQLIPSHPIGYTLTQCVSCYVCLSSFVGFAEDGGIQVELARDGEVDCALLIIEQSPLKGQQLLPVFWILSYCQW